MNDVRTVAATDVSQQTGGLLVDIRSPVAWAEGVAPQALLLSADELRGQALDLLAEHQLVYVMCYQGQSSSILCAELGDGFVSVAGGFAAWQAQGLAIEVPQLAEQDIRYDRQIKIPGFGQAGQQRLAEAHILVIGAGGLGSPALLYLAGSGVGQLTLVDDDVVALHNLHRQILYTEQDVNLSKVEQAKQRLQQLNGNTRIHAVNERLTADNAHELVAAADLVIDGSDNVTTRYVLNDVCLQLQKPWLFAAVSGFSIQVAMFGPDTLCYRCLFPDLAEGALGNCNEEGILGPVPGLAAMIQVLEAIKLITQSSSNLKHHLLTYDLLTHDFKMLKYPAQTSCQHREKLT